MDSLSSIFWGTFVLAPLLEDCGPTSASPQAAKNAAAAPAAMTPRLVTGRIDHRRKSSSSVTDSPFCSTRTRSLDETGLNFLWFESGVVDQHQGVTYGPAHFDDFPEPPALGNRILPSLALHDDFGATGNLDMELDYVA